MNHGHHTPLTRSLPAGPLSPPISLAPTDGRPLWLAAVASVAASATLVFALLRPTPAPVASIVPPRPAVSSVAVERYLTGLRRGTLVVRRATCPTRERFGDGDRIRCAIELSDGRETHAIVVGRETHGRIVLHLSYVVPAAR